MKSKLFAKIIAFSLLLALVLALVFYPSQTAEQTEKVVVRVWNVDTFEGGKGSRANFLKSVAKSLEKQKKVYYLIENYTAEGAKNAISKGNLPDMLSFGVGLDDGLEYALSLSQSSAGGEVGGKTRATAWYRGGYALFSLSGFEKEGKTVISRGGNNLPEVAAALSQIKGEEHSSLEAYVAFLSGEYDYLLGTQRDYCRFTARGTQVNVKPLSKFCDLYGYMSIFSTEKWVECNALLTALLSNETQSRLSEIGMYPVEWGLDEISREKAEYTVSVFSSQSALEEMRQIAREKDAEKNLNKFLKKV